MQPRTTPERECDVLVVGAGVVGCAIARELGAWDLSVCVVEQAEDVCCGTSKANSGIVHAGFDAAPGSEMARYNVAGAALMPEVCEELGVPYRANGSLVLCFEEAGRSRLQRLLGQGVANGVAGLQILSGDEARELEPCVSDEVVAALWAPTAGIVDPFLLTVAYAENAAANGCEFFFDEQVRSIEAAGDGWRVETNRGPWRASVVVNAAGLGAAELFNAADPENALVQRPRRGSYLLLDKTAEPVPSMTLFQLPTDHGKGVLVAPTCHGNTLVGPTAADIDDPWDTATSAAELEEVQKKALRSVPGLPLRSVITSFAGVRAHQEGHDFVIRETQPGLFHAAGIESPGLTSAPAIGRELARQVAARLCAAQRPSVVRRRDAQRRFFEQDDEAQRAMLRERPSHGQMVCRCELVTRGEIEEAMARPVPPRTLDGVKRRLRAGMGRCQGGFCSPVVMDLLEGGFHMTPEAVHKGASGSWIVCGPTKGPGSVAGSGASQTQKGGAA